MLEPLDASSDSGFSGTQVGVEDFLGSRKRCRATRDVRVPERALFTDAG